MGFYTSYNGIFTALKTLLEAKSSLNTVCVGTRYTYETGLPAAVVTIDPSPIVQMNIDQLEVKVNFTVLLLVREEEPDNWFSEVVTVMADVIDAVLADRTIGGSVDDVTPIGFAPGSITTINRVVYGGEVKFEATLLYAS